VNLGWIQYGKEVMKRDGIPVHAFADFQYRPDAATASRYFKSGHHAWNLGYFVATPRFLWKQYQKYAPNLYEGLKKIRLPTEKIV
jgi:mannose-1-phosphate guanylyltransferase